MCVTQDKSDVIVVASKSSALPAIDTMQGSLSSAVRMSRVQLQEQSPASHVHLGLSVVVPCQAGSLWDP